VHRWIETLGAVDLDERLKAGGSTQLIGAPHPRVSGRQ